MINLKRKNSLMLLVFALASSASAEDAKVAPTECSKEWATTGQMKSKNYIFGLGISSKPDGVSALEEAKANAYKDVGQQLQSTVKSDSELSETQNGSSFKANTQVSVNGKDLVGIKTVKEGKNPTGGITSCVVAKFDVGSVYTEAEGQMNVLLAQLKEIFSLATNKKYVEVLQKRKKAHELINANSDQINRAEMFRTYIGMDNESWNEKIKGKMVEVDKVAEEAKGKVLFILPSGQYEATIGDIESRLSGAGFATSTDGKGSQPVKIKLELKQNGGLRKTHTALGHTYIANIAVALKDGTGKTIGTNKGTQITGTGQSEDDAMANVDRQLIKVVLDVYDSALPGLIETE